MLRYAHHHESVSMNVTPLIDVVFLLIIFFLVSSHLARQEQQVKIDLPDARTGEPADAPAARVVTLSLLASGQVLLAGDETPLELLSKRLGHEVRRHASPLEVRLRADRSVAYSKVAPVLVACAEANVWNIRFAVREQGR